ncbi:MAG: polyprotein [Grapevine secovirus]|nr:MAG: polyprotein [Grapevine secovirus]
MLSSISLLLDGESVNFVHTQEFHECVAIVRDLSPNIRGDCVELLLFCAIYGRKCKDRDEVVFVGTQAVLAAGDTAGAIAIIRGFFITQFEMDIEFPINGSYPANACGQSGLFTAASSLFWATFAKGASAIKGARDYTLESIWALARKAFIACLGGHAEVVMKAASWIDDVWKRMSAWCHEMVTNSAQWMAGFRECLAFGMGIVGVAAVLVLVEKFMIGCGILSGPMNLAQTFVLCFVSYIGLRDGGSKISSGAAVYMSGLVAACKDVVCAIATSMSADGSNAQSNPVELLEIFTKSVSGISAASVVQTGRVFNAVTQVKNGCATIWSCIQQISSFLWEMLDQGFGIKSRALADLSVMLGQDVQGWLRRCDAACEHMCLFPSVPQDILTNFKNLKCQGQSIRAALLSRSERGSVAALSSVNKALERLNELLTSAILAGSGGPRYEPMWLAFIGQPGVGKSTVVNSMVARYLEDNNLEQGDSYARNCLDPYWSGYRRQAVVTYDDLGALSNGSTVSEEAELIKLVSRDALPLNMASLEEKGMFFDSGLILTSSNFTSYSPQAGIHDAQAYYRRRSMLIEVKKKADVPMSADSPLAHQMYVLRRSAEPFDELQTFDTFEDLYAYFLNLRKDHDEKQRQIMASMRLRPVTLDTKVSALSAILPMLTGVVPISIDEFLKKHHPGWYFLCYHNGKMYIANQNTELKILTDFDSVESDDLNRAEQAALNTAVRFGGMLRNMPNLDPLVTHYLADLVEKNVYTPDLTVRSMLKREDEQLYELADKMPSWQRAMVYVLSTKMSESNQGFFSNLYVQMCDTLQKAYAMDVKRWPVAVKVGLGLAAFLVLGKTVLWTLSYLGAFGHGAAFTLAATRTFALGQSDDEVRRNTSEYRHRNAPVRARHWSYAQNTGISFEWMMKHCLGSLCWGHRHCQVLLLPGKQLVGVNHFLKGIPDGVIVEITMDYQQFCVSWHKDCLTLCEGSELSVYRHATLRDMPFSVMDRCVFGLEHLPDTFPAVFCSCKIDEISGEYIPEYASITVKKRNVALNVFHGQYQRLVPVCLEYQAVTVNRDCGSLIIANINGMDRLVGLHVSGVGGFGQACLLPSELQMSVAQNHFEPDFVEFEYPESVGDGTQVVGLLKPEKKFYTQQKTSYVRTPDEWHLGTTCMKEPAILSKFDDRLLGSANAGYDPYRVGMAKYKDAAGPFEEDTISLASEQIVEEWFDAAGNFDFSECSLAEAINGVPDVEYYDPLVLNTSEGYPYLLSRDHNKGKARFLVEEEGKLVPGDELRAGIERIEQECLVRVPTLVGVECAKDEKLPLRKIYETPKTRLFTVLPMDFNIVVRKKFFPFVKFLMQNRDRLPCQVGLNPYGREWGRVALTLLEKGDSILCCDYSRFDGIMPKQIMWIIAGMINRLMGGSDSLQTQRANLLMACSGRYGICAGKVWRVENGIPSGFPLTVIINSVFNELIVRYIYLQVFVGDRLMRASFRRYVSLVVYGDDNLISVSPTISMVFNGESIQRIAKSMKIGITDGVDKTLDVLNFRTLSQCDFLKRSFVKDRHGRWRAPMDLDSLWTQLHWVKTQFLGRNEAYLVNLEAVLRELFLHDVGLAKTYRAKALTIGWVEPSMLPTLEQIEAFHEMQMCGKEIVAYGYDALLMPTMLGPIGAVEKDAHDFEFRNLVASRSGIYKFVPGDFVLCLRVASKYGEDGIEVNWPLTSGRGELPTAGWLRENLLRKNCEMYRLLKGKIKEGRRLVFLARNNNVFSTVFLVLVGLEFRMIRVEESNQILSKAISMVRQLGYLVDVFPEAFFSRGRDCDVNRVGKKILDVFNASPSEVNAMRLSTSMALRAVEGVLPVFPLDNIEMYTTYLRDQGKSGILLLTELRVNALQGLPGPLWRDWIKRGAGDYQDCTFVAHVVYFDEMNTLHSEVSVPCAVCRGNRLFEVLIINGKPLQHHSKDDQIFLHPIGAAMRQLEGKFRDGFESNFASEDVKLLP